jgi:hypothetical protein
MKLKLLLSFLLIGQFAFSQISKRIAVAGTHCSMVPPEGFVAATDFRGFQNAEMKESIVVTELPAPYQAIVDELTVDALRGRGITLLDKKVIDFNNGKATFLTAEQTANGTTYSKQMLIFGDTKHTVLINGIYPESDKQMDAKIKAALLSTTYN